MLNASQSDHKGSNDCDEMILLTEMMEGNDISDRLHITTNRRRNDFNILNCQNKVNVDVGIDKVEGQGIFSKLIKIKKRMKFKKRMKIKIKK